MRFQHQRYLTEEDGDCFAACVASILGVELADTPNFCRLREWWQEFLDWLGDRGLTAFNVNMGGARFYPLMPGVPVILTGPSRTVVGGRHSVVAVTHDAGFEPVFDPNPSGGFLAGPPNNVTFFVPLVPRVLPLRPVDGEPPETVP